MAAQSEKPAISEPKTAKHPNAPASETPAKSTKIEQLIALLSRPEGAQIAQISAELGWQAHSIRGAIAGTLKKKLGITVVSEKRDGFRVYRILPAEPS